MALLKRKKQDNSKTEEKKERKPVYLNLMNEQTFKSIMWSRYKGIEVPENCKEAWESFIANPTSVCTFDATGMANKGIYKYEFKDSEDKVVGDNWYVITLDEAHAIVVRIERTGIVNQGVNEKGEFQGNVIFASLKDGKVELKKPAEGSRVSTIMNGDMGTVVDPEKGVLYGLQKIYTNPLLDNRLNSGNNLYRTLANSVNATHLCIYKIKDNYCLLMCDKNLNQIEGSEIIFKSEKLEDVAAVVENCFATDSEKQLDSLRKIIQGSKLFGIMKNPNNALVSMAKAFEDEASARETLNIVGAENVKVLVNRAIYMGAAQEQIEKIANSTEEATKAAVDKEANEVKQSIKDMSTTEWRELAEAQIAKDKLKEQFDKYNADKSKKNKGPAKESEESNKSNRGKSGKASSRYRAKAAKGIQSLMAEELEKAVKSINGSNNEASK